MELLINRVARIEAEFIINKDEFVLRKEDISNEERDSFFELFSGDRPTIINDGEKEWSLKKISTSYNDKNDSELYNVSVWFREYTEEDKKDENIPDFNTFIMIESFKNRLRIEGLQKILIEKGIVDSEEDFLFDNLFGENGYYEHMNKYRKDFADQFEIDLEE